MVMFSESQKLTFWSFQSVRIVMMRISSSIQFPPVTIRFTESKLGKWYGRFLWHLFPDYYLMQFHFEFDFSCTLTIVSDSTHCCFIELLSFSIHKRQSCFTPVNNGLETPLGALADTLRSGDASFIDFDQASDQFCFFLPFCSISLGTRLFKHPCNSIQIHRR